MALRKETVYPLKISRRGGGCCKESGPGDSTDGALGSK